MSSWQRKWFRDYWAKLIRGGKPGWPRVQVEVQDVIHRMSFLLNHMKEIIAIDFFVGPKIRKQVLKVFLVLELERRRVIHFNVTTNPTAEWTGQQILEAFRWDAPPKYLLRDRDRIYEWAFGSAWQPSVSTRY